MSIMRFIKIITILIINLLILHSTDVFAQKKHRISVDVGLANYTNRDDLASPLLYKGNQKKINVFYNYRGMKNWHWVQVHIMTGELKTSARRSFADHYYGQIQYGYARLLSVGSTTNRTFWWGGSWDTMVSARGYSYLREEFSTATGIFATTLNINLLCELLSLNKQRVVFSFSAPVLGYLLRNGYAVKTPDITNRLTSLNSYQRFRFSSLYERTLSAYIKLRLTYWFLYQRYSQPRKTISVFHGLSGGISFQF